MKRGIRYKIRVKTYRLVKKIAPKFAEKHFGSAEYKNAFSGDAESYKKIVNEDLREDARESRKRSFTRRRDGG